MRKRWQDKYAIQWQWRASIHPLCRFMHDIHFINIIYFILGLLKTLHYGLLDEQIVRYPQYLWVWDVKLRFCQNISGMSHSLSPLVNVWSIENQVHVVITLIVYHFETVHKCTEFYNFTHMMGVWYMYL